MAGKDLDGFVVVVTGGSTGLGRAIAVEDRRRAARRRWSSTTPPTRPRPRRPRAGSRPRAPRPCWSRATSPTTRTAAGSPPPPSRSAASTPCSTTPASDHVRQPRRPGRRLGRGLPAHLCGQCGRRLPDGPRLPARCWRPRRRPGAVVNTASIAGVTGIGSSVPYAASKGALVTMTLSLARALAPEDPRQRHLPRLHRHAVVRPRHAGRGGATGCARAAAASTPLKVASNARGHRRRGGLLGLAGRAPHHRRDPAGRRRPHLGRASLAMR